MRCSRYKPPQNVLPLSFLSLFRRIKMNKQTAVSRLLTGVVVFSPQTDKGFDKTMFERQMSVMRGQVSVFSPSAFSLFPLCPLILFVPFISYLALLSLSGAPL